MNVRSDLAMVYFMGYEDVSDRLRELEVEAG